MQTGMQPYVMAYFREGEDAQAAQAEAREALAARLDRLACRVRTETAATPEAAFDKAYAKVVKLAVELGEVLQYAT